MPISTVQFPPVTNFSQAITHCPISVCNIPHMLVPTVHCVQCPPVTHLTSYYQLSNSYLSYTAHANTHSPIPTSNKFLTSYYPLPNSCLSYTSHAITHCSIPFCHTHHMLLPTVQFLSVLHLTCCYPLFNSFLPYTSHANTHCLIPFCHTPHMLIPTDSSHMLHIFHAIISWQFISVIQLTSVYICHPAHLLVPTVQFPPFKLLTCCYPLSSSYSYLS
jgi:hypothetical protein